jgi:hypothetical protein
MEALESLLTTRLPRGEFAQISNPIEAVFPIDYNGEPGWDRTNDHLIKSHVGGA